MTPDAASAQPQNAQDAQKTGPVVSASPAVPFPPPPPRPSEAKPAPPAEFPPPVRATIDWLQRRFASWYRDHPPAMPDRFTRREFGFILWPDRPGAPPFVRHRAYENAERLHSYLRYAGPHSAYYSTAYYRRPGEMKMVDKQWLGAELIFDLDADHLAEVEAAKEKGAEVPLARQLELVKRQFLRLVEDFLLGDFGLSERDLFVSFSGSRGYHAHVVEPRLMQLDSRGRREIVDYVTGKVPAEKGSDKPDLSVFLRKTPVHVEGRGKFAKVTFTERLAPRDEPGWPGRITRTLVTALNENVIERPDKEALGWLMQMEGVGEKTAKDFLAKTRGDAGFLERLETQAVVSQGSVFKRICLNILKESALPMAKGETDEPVTADTKRLIRLPGSLHGKSGLMARTLTLDEVRGFDPFRDAVAFGMDPVRIIPRNDQEMTLRGERVAVKKGEAVEVPEAHAVFWCARQAGTVVPTNR